MDTPKGLTRPDDHFMRAMANVLSHPSNDTTERPDGYLCKQIKRARKRLKKRNKHPYLRAMKAKLKRQKNRKRSKSAHQC